MGTYSTCLYLTEKEMGGVLKFQHVQRPYAINCTPPYKSDMEKNHCSWNELQNLAFRKSQTSVQLLDRWGASSSMCAFG